VVQVKGVFARLGLAVAFVYVLAIVAARFWANTKSC
jgi:hypothetical protein